MRLLKSEVATLEASRGSNDFSCEIELIDDGPLLEYQALRSTDRCATAFSGGKDSLTQVGILAELTERPILVTTTSEMPPLVDHHTPRRRHILAEIQRRRDVDFVDVESDYRGNFDHGFAMSLGYHISVNELTDTFLYTGALIATAAAMGASHLFIASEAQLDENIAFNGHIIQHHHLMYSTPTVGAIRAILRPFGLTYSSLITALFRYHVHTLLWMRYADLSDLRYSCWLVKGDELACNRCIKCFVLSIRELTLGGDTSKLGVNWVVLLNHYRDWIPKRREEKEPPMMPRDIHWVTTDAQISRDMIAISWLRMARTLAHDDLTSLFTLDGWRALGAYRKLRRRAIDSNPGPIPGYRAGSLKFVDPLLRARLAAIYSEHFIAADESVDKDLLGRCEGLLNWIIEPLRKSEAQDE